MGGLAGVWQATIWDSCTGGLGPPGIVLKEFGLPGLQDVVGATGNPRELRELGAVGDQGRFQFNTCGDLVADGLEAVLQDDFGGSERGLI